MNCRQHLDLVFVLIEYDVVKLLFGASRVHAVGDTYLGEHGVSPSEPCFLTLGFVLSVLTGTFG